MSIVRLCASEQDYAAADDLRSKLAAWDATETHKMGIDGQSVLDFYYGAAAKLPQTATDASYVSLLGFVGGEVGGCVSYRAMQPGICEMKHLYVRPAVRGSGLGRALVSSLISHAREAGFGQMRLETVTFMGSAIRMYERVGFVRRPPYYEIPEIFLPITVFMEKDLALT